MDADLYDLHIAEAIGVPYADLGRWTRQDALDVLAFRAGKALGEWATLHPWEEAVKHRGR